jgi:DNA-binding beta-propeller fold protein YncE
MLLGTGEHTYELAGGWAKLPEGESFVDVSGMAIDSQDRIYVFNRGAHPVMVFDREGNLLSAWGNGLFDRPHGIFVGPDGSVYCTDDGNHTVTKYTPDGRLLMTLGNKNRPSDTGYVKVGALAENVLTIQRSAPPFNRPTGVHVPLSGEIYVSDGYGNARVHKFAPDGTLLLSWGEPGTGPGQFRVPHVVRVDREDRVWVCDRENSRIQIFDSGGKLLSIWDHIAGKPTDLFFDFAGKGTVYVGLKSWNLPHGLSIFTMDGKLLARWGRTQAEDAMFWTPHSLVVDSRGDIYVGEIRHEMASVDRGSRAVQKFVRKT